MDKINDKQPIVRKFQCIHCDEKPFTTKANMLRHISRKHKNIENELEVTDNVSVLSGSTKSETNPMDYILDVPDSPIGSLSPQPDPIPSDDYLLTLIQEYEKYQHLFPAIKRRMKWNENNSNVDLNYHLRKHNHKFTYILTDIKDLYAVPING